MPAGSRNEMSPEGASQSLDHHMTRYYAKLPVPQRQQMFLAAAAHGSLECVQHFMSVEGYYPKDAFGEEKSSAYGMALWCTQQGPKKHRASAFRCMEAMQEVCGVAEDLPDGPPSWEMVDEGAWRAPSDTEDKAVDGSSPDEPEVVDEGLHEDPSDHEFDDTRTADLQ